MADLRQILSQGRNRIVEDDGHLLIPDVAGLTDDVVSALTEGARNIVEILKSEIADPVNIETILTKIRRAWFRQQ